MSKQQPEPLFIQIQHQFSAYLRDPLHNAPPKGMTRERAEIYGKLIFNNLSSILSKAFPVLFTLFDKTEWDSLIRDFCHQHHSQTPLFAKVPEEFLSYLEKERMHKNDYPFLYELAHYEWVELALFLHEARIEQLSVNPHGNPYEEIPVLSPVAWLMQYHYPVHQIGKNFIPEAPLEEPFFIIVYRNRTDKVKFLEINAITARLVALLEEHPSLTGAKAILHLIHETQHPRPDIVRKGGMDILQQLKELDIILGTQQKSSHEAIKGFIDLP